MIFNSLQYAAFLPVVVVVYWTLRGTPRRVWLLLASWAFYAAWDWRFLSLVWISTATDFLVGRALGKSRDPARRKLILGASLVVNLGILGFFKYFNFFVDSFTDLLARTGLEADPVTLSILLPVGISFYTFQAISYTVDVYRGRIQPTEDPLLYATFVAFFPQLLAGPIGRAEALFPQFEREVDRLRTNQVGTALALILLGLVKKVVVADTMAQIASPVFDNPDEFGSIAVALGIVAFALQIYADFSAYTDIARGSSQLFGIDLAHNFDAPYLSRHITEFWHRWHVSLSTWLRDYLYVPLGGNRRGTGRTYLNLMIVMLLGGLWHGANATFLIWGGLHGVFLALHRALRPTAMSEVTVPRGVTQWLSALGTFVLVSLAWVFFRSPDVGAAFDVLGQLVSTHIGSIDLSDLALVVASMVGLAIVDAARVHHFNPRQAAMDHPALAGFLVGTALVLLVIYSGSTPVPFIYFQF